VSCAKGREGGGDVRLAFAETGVLTAAVTHSAPVETEHRMSGFGDAGRQLGLAIEGTRADLVAAGDDQQAAGAWRVIQRADERFALAREFEVAAAHRASARVIRPAKASACSAL
jgi:hypothetical protein